MRPLKKGDYSGLRLFQTGIVLGKNEFFRASCDARVRLRLGAGVRYSSLSRLLETLYQSVSCRRRLRRTALCGTPGMATQARQAYHRRYWSSSISCRSTWLQSSAPSPPEQSDCLSFIIMIIGMPNRSCIILKFRTNQCFVCNFFSMPRCQCQIAPKKAQSLSCLACNFQNMLTPIKVVCDS